MNKVISVIVLISLILVSCSSVDPFGADSYNSVGDQDVNLYTARIKSRREMILAKVWRSGLDSESSLVSLELHFEDSPYLGDIRADLHAPQEELDKGRSVGSIIQLDVVEQDDDMKLDDRKIFLDGATFRLNRYGFWDIYQVKLGYDNPWKINPKLEYSHVFARVEEDAE